MRPVINNFDFFSLNKVNVNPAPEPNNAILEYLVYLIHSDGANEYAASINEEPTILQIKIITKSTQKLNRMDQLIVLPT